MLAKIDHPQYHPTTFKRTVSAVRSIKETNAKQEWRGGAKVSKR
jgi:hypothetical protein